MLIFGLCINVFMTAWNSVPGLYPKIGVNPAYVNAYDPGSYLQGYTGSSSLFWGDPVRAAALFLQTTNTLLLGVPLLVQQVELSTVGVTTPISYIIGAIWFAMWSWRIIDFFRGGPLFD